MLGQPGTLSGVTDEPILIDSSVDLEPGDVVMFFTDGLTEARSGDIFYGEDRVAAAFARLASSDLSTIVDSIVSDAVEFQGGTTRDDIVVVVIKVPMLAGRGC